MVMLDTVRSEIFRQEMRCRREKPLFATPSRVNLVRVPTVRAGNVTAIDVWAVGLAEHV